MRGSDEQIEDNMPCHLYFAFAEFGTVGYELVAHGRMTEKVFQQLSGVRRYFRIRNISSISRILEPRSRGVG